jgi:hypothetical protein
MAQWTEEQVGSDFTTDGVVGRGGCARYCADDAGGALPSGACEDVAQSETANAADPSQAAAVEAIAIENDLRAALRNFGLKVGMVGTVKFEAHIKELVENQPDVAALVEPLLIVRRVVREQTVILHRRLLAIVGPRSSSARPPWIVSFSFAEHRSWKCIVSS